MLNNFENNAVFKENLNYLEKIRRCTYLPKSANSVLNVIIAIMMVRVGMHHNITGYYVTRKTNCLNKLNT